MNVLLVLFFRRRQYDVDVVRERKFVLRRAELGYSEAAVKGEAMRSLSHSKSLLTSHICTSDRPPKQLIQQYYLCVSQELVELFWDV